MTVITLITTFVLLLLILSVRDGIVGAHVIGEGSLDVLPRGGRACYDCEARLDDQNFVGCTAEPWRTAGVRLCKPWQVFCYKYKETSFCKELNSTTVKYIRRGCSGNLLHKFCIPYFMDCNSYTCYGDYCNGSGQMGGFGPKSEQLIKLLVTCGLLAALSRLWS